MKNFLLIFLFLLAGNFSFANEKNFSSLIGKKAPAWELEDQFEKKFSSKNYSGKNVIYILTDRSANEFIKNWTSDLEKYKEKFSIVNIGDLSSAPGFMKGFLRKIFREKISFSLLLDWDGDVIEFYDYPEDVPMLVAVDSEGKIRAVTVGKGTKEETKKFTEELKKIFALGS